MKQLLIMVLFLCMAMSAMSQAPSAVGNASAGQTVRPTISMPETSALLAFSQIEIEGPMDVILRKITDGEAVHIVYDTKGFTTSRFKATVTKEGVLRVEERYDPKRESRTSVTIFYDDISSLRVVMASVKVEGLLETRIFDLIVSGGATVETDVRLLDMAVTCTGKSAIVLKGATRYFDIDVSTANIDASAFSAVSAIVKASHGAEVALTATERLEATTSTAAKLTYKGHPEIVRTKTALFGGEIVALD